MARKEIPFIVEEEGRDKGKEFLITEMSAWDADSLAQDIFRAMGDSNYSSIPPDVIAMGCAGLATVGLSVISASSPEVARQLRDRLMSTVDIIITNDGKRQQRKVNGSLDFEEVSTIRSLLDKVFQVNFDFLTIAGE
ncbi:hypothetical protein [Salmonella enterica]|uniref:hypothetical protein n=1 Tax=Salmonella enterica TaxID=28901 RepID=UPI000FB5384E|nr:hypothetical protein [Salmonella enterica]EAA8256849.1 hypothetical protein [Salmonella enterica subsp. enterica]EBV5389300.1 hypothetical protein [Salmonella enterica subsp. enterica serovar Tananarive]EDB4177662.1 hypothetical protein [Salmonella enterica subsp. enterica serovar Poona]EGZ3989284.1 hypothetical protein [Salmonella enterica subsp. enterica serovar Giza]EAM2896656.1 hypothetical protein [Salmonella enterica]